MQFLLKAFDGTDPDRHALDATLRNEPYFTEGVWEKIEIRPFRDADIK